MSENDKLAVVSKARTALAKAENFDQVVSLRNSAKAARTILKDKFSPADIRKGLSSALDLRDRALEAEAIELLAEHKAGAMLNSLKTEKAGDQPKLTVAEVCRSAEVNSNVANFWQRLAKDGPMNETKLAEYVEFVQNSDVPAIIRAGVSREGFRAYCKGKGEVYVHAIKHDFAIMLLGSATEEGLDALVDVSLRGATQAQAKNLREGRKGILEKGVITRGRK